MYRKQHIISGGFITCFLENELFPKLIISSSDFNKKEEKKINENEETGKKETSIIKVDDPSPCVCDFFKRKAPILKVAVGHNHFLVLDRTGAVFSGGENSYGQRGSKLDDENGESLIKFEKITRVQFPTGDDGNIPKIVSISAGQHHSGFVSEDQFVFMCGSSGFGKLGVGALKENESDDNIEIPVKIPTIKGIISLSLGWNHSIFVHKSGNVFSCGANADGQCGIDSFENINKPHLVLFPDPVKIIQVAAGSFHSCCLSQNLELFSFGWNNHGQLGLGHSKNIKVPVKVSSSARFVSVSCGSYHTTLLDGNGFVYTCGKSDYEQCGTHLRETQEKKDVKEKKNTHGEYNISRNYETFHQIQLPTKRKITQIECGYWRTFLLNDMGEVFGIGDNDKGQLGTGDKTDKFEWQLLKIKLLQKKDFWVKNVRIYSDIVIKTQT